MPQTERQRRWYADLTPEQREARRVRQRERRRERFATDLDFCERERESNALRIFAGNTYVCRADSPEQAEALNALVARRMAEFYAGLPTFADWLEKRAAKD